MTDAYLKSTLYRVTIFPPSCEGKWLPHESQIYTHFDKGRALILKKHLQTIALKISSLRKSLSLCLCAILVHIVAHLNCYTHFPRFRSASNHNSFKVFSLLVFSQDLQMTKQITKQIVNSLFCKLFSLKKYESKQSTTGY